VRVLIAQNAANRGNDRENRDNFGRIAKIS
jgi:hypothetical protein